MPLFVLEIVLCHYCVSCDIWAVDRVLAFFCISKIQAKAVSCHFKSNWTLWSCSFDSFWNLWVENDWCKDLQTVVQNFFTLLNCCSLVLDFKVLFNLNMNSEILGWKHLCELFRPSISVSLSTYRNLFFL